MKLMKVINGVKQWNIYISFFLSLKETPEETLQDISATRGE